MNLHFLVSISSESENLYGIRFLCSFFGSCKNIDVTLFHISSSNDNSSASLLNMWENPAEKLENMITPAARKALNQAKFHIDSGSISVDELKTKTIMERHGKVKDILTEAANGLYDAVILGRRATYTLQWMFERPADEIPQALIRDASLSSPMWVCNEPEEGRKNVLLCLDGSASALRVADHVGYILSYLPQHTITLFHVCNPVSNNAEKIFQDGVDILSKHNIAPERILQKTTWGLSVTNCILSEKSNGKYAVVAVGLIGTNEKNASPPNTMVGKTASVLLKAISKAALWYCP